MMKKKYLQSINKIRESFGIHALPSKLTRTVSFRVFPKGKDKLLMDKYFDQYSEAKYMLLYKILDLYKKGKINLFTDPPKYETYFKGKDIIKELKNEFQVLKNRGIETGLRGEDVEGLLESFITHTKKRLVGFVATLDRLLEKEDLEEEERKFLQESLKELSIYYKKQNGKIILNLNNLNYQNWHRLKHLTEEIISRVKGFNYQRNQEGKSTLSRLYNLPKFPILERYPDINSFRRRFSLKDFTEILEEFRQELEKFKEVYLNTKKVDENLVSRYLSEKIQVLIKKEQYLSKHGKKIKSRKFKERFLFWIYKNNPALEEIIEHLFKRLKKQEVHLFKKPFDPRGRNEFFNTLLLLAEIFYVSQSENPDESLSEINTQISRLRAYFQKGKGIKDTFTIAGFGWKKNKGNPTKPQYGCSLVLKRNQEKIKLGLVLFSSDSAICFKPDHSKDFSYIIQTGGSRKESQFVPKTLSFREGHLERGKDPLSLLLWLHFGKSYARRVLFHKDWGFLSTNSPNKFFLANARFKRVKEKPGDDFEYYVDITFQYQLIGEEKVDFSKIKERIKYVIGLDRGERVPLAYAVIDLEGNVKDKGVLGQNLSRKLVKLQKEREKGRRVGHKIRNLQETILHQGISEILHLLAQYPGVISLEKLSKRFKGKEKSLIPKKTYNKSKIFLEQMLEFTGLSLISLKRMIIEVDPRNTSMTCPKCGTNFGEVQSKLKKLKISDLKNLSPKILQEALIEVNGVNIKLPSKWTVWKEEHPTYVSLQKIKDLIANDEYKEARSLIETVTPRITQDKFVCLNPDCNFQENADIVGAINIARRGLENFLT